MDFAARISTAGQFVELLRLLEHERDIPRTLRARTGSACLGLAQEHHHSIVLLTERGLYGSAFTLLRSVFEAYVRGVWLLHCATDQQVDAFANGTKPPKISLLILAVEETLQFQEGNLSGVERAHWSAMCAYTHSGGLHVQRWQTEESVEPSYQEDEVNEMLLLAELFGAVSAVALLGLIGDETAVNKVVRAVGERTDVL